MSLGGEATPPPATPAGAIPTPAAGQRSLLYLCLHHSCIRASDPGASAANQVRVAQTKVTYGYSL